MSEISLLRYLNLTEESLKKMKADLQALAEAPLADVEKVISFLPQLSEAITVGIREEIRQKLYSDLDLSNQQRSKVISITNFLSSALIDLIDKEILVSSQPGETISTEFMDEGLIDKKHFGTLSEYINKIYEFASGSQISREIKKHESGVLPSLYGIESTVELRGVMKGAWRAGMDLEEYMPSLITYVPIASVHIEASNDEELYFQVSEDTLDLLISSLDAARKEMQLIKKDIDKIRN